MFAYYGDTVYRVKDASEGFKGKFVFYSPKKTFGVDFTIDVPQDVFIYISGGPSYQLGPTNKLHVAETFEAYTTMGKPCKLKPCTQVWKMSKHP